MTEVEETANTENICPKSIDNHKMTIDDLIKSTMVSLDQAKSSKTKARDQESHVGSKNEPENGDENAFVDLKENLSECSSDFDPNEYDVIEFTQEHKKQIILLLNEFMPDLNPLQSFNEKNRLYSRLACLMQFFNDFFRIYELWPLMARMPINIRTQKSAQDLELIEDEIKIKQLYHYFRCWLRLFYVCDGIIDSLDSSSGSLEMVAIMILNIFNIMRDSLPQVRRILNEKWLPFKSFETKFQSVLKYDKITTILSEQLVQERIGHQLSIQKQLKLKLELNAKQVELDFVKRNLEKLKFSYNSISQQLPPKQYSISSKSINNNTITIPPMIPQQQSKSHLQSILLAPVLQTPQQTPPLSSQPPVVNSVNTLPEPEQKQSTMLQSPPKASTPPIEIETVPDIILPLKIKLEIDSEPSEQPASFELPPRKRAPPKRLLSPGLNLDSSKTEVVSNSTLAKYDDNLKSKKPRLTSSSSTSTGSSLITVLNSKTLDSLNQSIRPKNRKPKVSILKMSSGRAQGNVVQQPKSIPIVVPVDPLKSIVKMNNNSQSLLTPNTKSNPNENSDGKNLIKLPTPKSLLIRPFNNSRNILAVPIAASNSDQLMVSPQSSSSMDIITMTVKDPTTIIKSTNTIDVPPNVVANNSIAETGSTEANSKNLTCRQCFQEFPDYKTYHAHTYEHEYLSKKSRESGSKGMIKCQYCIKMFPNSYKLKRHLISHTGLKPYQCEICQRCYTRSDKLREHMRGVHPAQFGKVEPIRLINLNSSTPSTTNQNGKTKKRTPPFASLLTPAAAAAITSDLKSAAAILEPKIGKLKLKTKKRNATSGTDSNSKQSGNNETGSKNGIPSTNLSVHPSQNNEQEDYFELIKIE